MTKISEADLLAHREEYDYRVGLALWFFSSIGLYQLGRRRGL